MPRAVIRIVQNTHDRRLYHKALPISWVKYILRDSSEMVARLVT
jgi:hypothetical protein